ncbi:hypothetical protein [Chryseobacterium sp. 2R14A]|uniref:hypothetical protein n=1 Tax=Chryseobacterium sp. 2R14A TaxID=3380353 RepID=UPI003CE9A515
MYFYQNVFQARIQITIDLDFVLQKGRLWNVDDTGVQDLLLIVGKKLTRSMNGKGDCNAKKRYLALSDLTIKSIKILMFNQSKNAA